VRVEVHVTHLSGNQDASVLLSLGIPDDIDVASTELSHLSDVACDKQNTRCDGEDKMEVYIEERVLCDPLWEALVFGDTSAAIAFIEARPERLPCSDESSVTIVLSLNACLGP